MEERIAKIEAILPTLATKADIAEVRGDIKGWMLATVLAIVGTMAALTYGLFSSLKPPAIVQQAPPIINNIIPAPQVTVIPAPPPVTK